MKQTLCVIQTLINLKAITISDAFFPPGPLVLDMKSFTEKQHWKLLETSFSEASHKYSTSTSFLVGWSEGKKRYSSLMTGDSCSLQKPSADSFARTMVFGNSHPLLAPYLKYTNTFFISNQGHRHTAPTGWSWEIHFTAAYPQPD